jgi:hypothetical protein
MKKISTIGKIVFFGALFLLLVACGESVSEMIVLSTMTASTESVSVVATISSNNPILTPLPTSTASITLTPTPTADPTYQAWYGTAVAVQGTANAISQQVRDDQATQIAQFPALCDENLPGTVSVSPSSTWVASSCGYKRNQTLVVQNKEGTIKWILDFKDFLHPDSLFDGEAPSGGLFPKFWSPDGEYLYFTSGIGYSGGGNDCFPGFGAYSLARLNLKTGSWVNLIPPTDSFPGYKITFSSTGRRYATDMDGVIITDLQTGEVVKLSTSGVMDLRWSPDGKHLAYSVASCGEQSVESSSVYIWDALRNQTQIVNTTEKMLLRPESWIDNSALRITEEKYVSPDMLYTVYVYDLMQEIITFTGTATPSP